MDKVFRAIAIFELVLLLIFLVGYFIYENNHRIDNQMSCEIDVIRAKIGEIDMTNINGIHIGLLSNKKEDLNS